MYLRLFVIRQEMLFAGRLIRSGGGQKNRTAQKKK